MYNESLSFAAENKIENRFAGKEHIIANVALSSLFASKEEIQEALLETSE